MITEPNVRQQLRKKLFRGLSVTRLIGQLDDHISQVSPRFHLIRLAAGHDAEQDGRSAATPIIPQK